jgi:hypothetical protein
MRLDKARALWRAASRRPALVSWVLIAMGLALFAALPLASDKVYVDEKGVLYTAYLAQARCARAAGPFLPTHTCGHTHAG